MSNTKKCSILAAFILAMIPACGTEEDVAQDFQVDDVGSDEAALNAGLSAALVANPATVNVGGNYRLTLTATNNGTSNTAIGIMSPRPGTVFSKPAGASCRATTVPSGWLYYCALSNFSGTATLAVTVPAPTVGTFAAQGYIRNTATMAEAISNTSIVVH